MKKSTVAGLVTTGIIGAAGLAYAMGDKKMRNKMMHSGKKILGNAENAMHKMDIL